MDFFPGGPPKLKGIKYFDLLLCHNHLLAKPNTCAKFEQNLPVSAWFSHGHILTRMLVYLSKVDKRKFRYKRYLQTSRIVRFYIFTFLHCLCNFKFSLA